MFGATGPRARSLVAQWTWEERAGAVTLLLGAIIALDVLLLHHSYEWYIGTHYWHRAFTYGLWAFGAFTIGVGVLPVLLGLAWAPAGRARDARGPVPSSDSSSARCCHSGSTRR